MSVPFIECKNCEDHLYLSDYPETAALVAERDNLKRANDLLQRQVCDFANTRPALVAERDALREALTNVLRDIADYERVNNLAPSPGKPDCWQSVTHARAALGSTTEAVASPPNGDTPIVWRDISTAPKNGTPIDLAFNSRRFHNYFYDHKNDRWVYLPHAGRDRMDQYFFGASEPTHWMAIPAIPRPDRGGAA